MRDVLIFGKKNYRDYVQSEEGISTNILADRLSKLVEHGILEKHSDPNNKLVINYEPTELGKTLIPVLVSMANWSIEHVPDTYRFDDMEGR